MYAGGKKAGGGGGDGGHWRPTTFLSFRMSVCGDFFFLPRVPGVRREDLGSSWPFWFQLELDYSAAHGLHINEILHDTLIHTRPGRSGEGTAQKNHKKKSEEGKNSFARQQNFRCSDRIGPKLSGPHRVTCFCAFWLIRNGRWFLHNPRRKRINLLNLKIKLK